MADHPELPGCGQKWARKGSPGWYSQIRPSQWASLLQPALEGGELWSPFSLRLLELALPSLLKYRSQGARLQYSYVQSETSLANGPFFCSLGRWTTQAPSSRGQQYNLCQIVCLCLWNTNLMCSFSLFTLYYCSNMNKLFILSSFPPCGSMHWLLSDYNFLMQQTEHKMLMTGFAHWATEPTLWLATQPHRCPFCFLFFQNTVSVHCRLFAWTGYRGKNHLNQITVETGFVS